MSGLHPAPTGSGGPRRSPTASIGTTRRHRRRGPLIAEGVIELDTLLGGWERVTAGYLIEGDAPGAHRDRQPELGARRCSPSSTGSASAPTIWPAWW